MLPNGKTVPGSACLILAIVHYPDDPITSRAYYQAMLLRQDQLKHDGKEAPKPRILEIIATDMNRRAGRLTAAAIVLDRAVVIHQAGAKASLRKAYAAAADLIVDQPSMGRKRPNIPSDERAIRDAFKEFRSVAHLWLAFLRVERDMFGLLQSKEKLKEFLTLAEAIQASVSRALPNTTWEKWMVPPGAPLDEEKHVFFRDDDDIERFLSGYTTMEYRE